MTLSLVYFQVGPRPHTNPITITSNFRDNALSYTSQPATMGFAFDGAVDRPEHIENILNGLDRYNPETTEIFSKYVMDQCENQTYDCYANLALLKLYVVPPTIQ